MNPFYRISTKQKMFFAQHMAIMSRSGMQILDILKALKKQNKSKSFGRILDDLIESVKNGQFLSEGLKKYQRLFEDFFINIVHVGEVSGTLADNLEYLADNLKKKRELQSKVKGVMVYPIIILVATMGLTGALTFFIFPKILPIFTSLNIKLPLVTRIFIAFSTFMIEHGIAVFGGIILLAIAIPLILRIVFLRRLWHRLLLHLPAVGTMVKNYNMVNFIRSLSLLLKSGVKIVEALEITSRSSINLIYREALEEIAQSVRKGEVMSKELAIHGKLFPGVFVEMISVGESTGKLTDTGIYLANYYEGELDNATKALSNILEPLMLLLMGGIVGFVALSIILPIYEVSQNIKPQ